MRNTPHPLRTLLLRTALLGMGALCSLAAHALTVDDIPKLKAGVAMQMPLPDVDESKLIDVQVQATRSMRDEDGTVWHGATVRAAGGEEWELLLHPADKPEEMVEVVVDRMKLRDLGLKGKDLDQMDKQRAGSISFDGQTYKLNWDDAEDTVITDAKGQTPAGVYRFDCVEDDDYALVIFEYEDGRFEVLQTQWLPTAQVTLR